MPDKKQAASKPKPLHTVRSGEVVITLSERQTNSGYSYRDMTLSREWSNQTSGRRAHGSTFFEKHEEDLVRAIHEAAAWLRASQAAPAVQDAGTLEDHKHDLPPKQDLG